MKVAKIMRTHMKIIFVSSALVSYLPDIIKYCQLCSSQFSYFVDIFPCIQFDLIHVWHISNELCGSHNNIADNCVLLQFNEHFQYVKSLV